MAVHHGLQPIADNVGNFQGGAPDFLPLPNGNIRGGALDFLPNGNIRGGAPHHHSDIIGNDQGGAPHHHMISSYDAIKEALRIII